MINNMEEWCQCSRGSGIRKLLSEKGVIFFGVKRISFNVASFRVYLNIKFIEREKRYIFYTNVSKNNNANENFYNEHSTFAISRHFLW